MQRTQSGEQGMIGWGSRESFWKGREDREGEGEGQVEGEGEGQEEEEGEGEREKEGETDGWTD